MASKEHPLRNPLYQTPGIKRMCPHKAPHADFGPENIFGSRPSQAPLSVRIWRSILRALHDSRCKEAQSSIRYYRHLYADTQGRPLSRSGTTRHRDQMSRSTRP